MLGYACHSNINGYFDLTICHMTILLYHFEHIIDGFLHNNLFWPTFFKFVLEQATATIELTKPVIYSYFDGGSSSKIETN